MRPPALQREQPPPRTPTPEPEPEMTEEEKMMAAMGLPTNFSSKPLDQEAVTPPTHNSRAPPRHQGYQHHSSGSMEHHAPPLNNDVDLYEPEDGIPLEDEPSHADPTLHNYVVVDQGPPPRRGVNGGAQIPPPKGALLEEPARKRRVFTGYSFIEMEEDEETGEGSGGDFTDAESVNNQTETGKYVFKLPSGFLIQFRNISIKYIVKSIVYWEKIP